jgi:GT2 family glycosyltransferase
LRITGTHRKLEVSAGLPLVLVPVFGARAELDECLDSLRRTLPRSAEVLICDDASPPDTVDGILDAFTRDAPFQVRVQRRERNLGFVRNVNLAFAETAPHDVVLLNSDTVVTPGWLQAIAACAGTDPRIGTITPWSNNAEICSYPRFCEASDLPDQPELLAEAAAALEPEAYADLPTGVGFCMYVRRALLEAIGDFDAATFGRGYGEENDLCFRAAAHGWRHVLCHTAFVGHRGGASFGAEGHRPGGENLARLNARYPSYNRIIAEFILSDPLRPLRERLAARIETARRYEQKDLFA